jgi:hypothetical protein
MQGDLNIITAGLVVALAFCTLIKALPRTSLHHCTMWRPEGIWCEWARLAHQPTVHIILFERDKEIAWDLGPDVPVPHFYGYRLDAGEDGVTNVTSYYGWSKVSGDLKERFPIMPESALRATLGILE